MSKVYNIGLQKYKEEKIRVCDKDSIPFPIKSINLSLILI